MNREVWLLLCGFPFDKKCMHEVANAVRGFGRLIEWDRNKSTRANLMVKVRVEELRHIPTSIVIGEGDDFQSGSHIVPVVILQQRILGAEPPDEDPIPPNGNPHPVPQQPHFHANQHNHFLGPLQHHEHDDVHLPDLNQDAEHPNLNLALQQPQIPDWDQEEEEQEMPGWGH